MLNTAFFTNVKKEYWEYQRILFWTPVIMVILMVGIPTLQLVFTGLEDYQLNRLQTIELDEQMGQQFEMIFFSFMLALFAPFMFVGLLVQLYYFTSTLYEERKDMSVYFWRSMPVSDLQVVLAKLLMGALLIPVIFLVAAVAALLVALIVALIGTIVLSSSYDVSLWSLWSNTGIFSSLGAIALSIVPYALWLFPLYAWFMLASMYARKAPFLWAVLPIVIIVMIEALIINYSSLSTPYFSQMFAEYFSIDGHSIKGTFVAHELTKMTPVQVLVDKISVIAIAVGVGFTALTLYFRKHRSEA